MDDREVQEERWIRWLEDRLSRELGAASRRPAPRWGLRVSGRRGMALGRLLATGAAVLALAGGTAMAADLTSAWTGGSGPSQVVSPAAPSCSSPSQGEQAACAQGGHGGSAAGGPRTLGTAGLTAPVTTSAAPAAPAADPGSATPAPVGGSGQGQSVSGAAHSCPTGGGGVHGRCVSSVAHASPTPSVTASPQVSPGGASSSSSGAHGRGH